MKLQEMMEGLAASKGNGEQPEMKVGEGAGDAAMGKDLLAKAEELKKMAEQLIEAAKGLGSEPEAPAPELEAEAVEESAEGEESAAPAGKLARMKAVKIELGKKFGG